jgi:hypothetical protein
MPLSTCLIPFIHRPGFVNEAVKDKDMDSGPVSFFEQYRFGPYNLGKREKQARLRPYLDRTGPWSQQIL